jgi:adenylate cyclase
MLYVFIFIALRALRFDPRFVVAAGVTAAAGWLVLLVYALLDSGGEAITRDYVQYMTSNRVLIGGEVDRIISILMVTLILAAVLVRARRLLDRAITESTAARELSRFVSPELASRIATAEREMQPGDGEVKHASVLFTDIEGFSTTAQRLKPAELFRTLNDYFQAVSEGIDRHGGVITQFEGDAMLVSYNTLEADPDHAANAVRTAIEIQELVGARRFGAGGVMKTRCGINTGELVAGAVGSKDRLLYTVHGDEVNIASRLDDLNKELGTYVLATAQTVAEAGGEFAFDRVGEVTVRGRATPTKVFALRA